MVDRINNSTGVLGALKYLQSSTVDLSRAETRVSSGLKVRSARDNVTAYHSSEIMKAQESSLNAVTLSLNRAESISDTAIGAGEQIAEEQLLAVQVPQHVGVEAVELTGVERLVHLAPPDLVRGRRLADHELVVRAPAGVGARHRAKRARFRQHPFAPADGVFVQSGGAEVRVHGPLGGEAEERSAGRSGAGRGGRRGGHEESSSA